MSAILQSKFVMVGMGPGGTYRFGSGSAAAPSMAFSASTGTGLYLFGSNQLGIASGGLLAFIAQRSGSVASLIGPNGSSALTADTSGALALVCGGTNQNITLTPSGTGAVVVGSGQLRVLPGATALQTGQTYGQIVQSTSGGSFPFNEVGHLVIAARDDANRGVHIQTGTGLANRFYFTGAGNLLLGTTTDSSNGRLQLATHTTSAGGIGFGPNLWAHLTNAQELAFGTTTTAEVLCINSQGLKLTVSGSLSAPNIFRNGDTNTGIWWGAADQLNLVTGGASALTLDASQNATFAANVLGANATQFGWTSRARIGSTADGVIVLYNTANTDFSRLQFGGTTTSFPALKRNGASFEVKTADDSAYVQMLMSQLAVGGATPAYVKAGTGTPEGAQAAPVGSVYLRTDGGASTTFYVKESGTGNTGWVAK